MSAARALGSEHSEKAQKYQTIKSRNRTSEFRQTSYPIPNMTWLFPIGCYTMYSTFDGLYPSAGDQSYLTKYGQYDATPPPL